ncbi:hypothetical protein JTE90_018562 [Oedothorax gibbosus]|uniref:Uncharacterized protein n=1 Tax=Oedothorax gibbosus TaxID=931172 RepID=A0AAV6U4V9_9ARAC|nr:hypothetical protein JTE90_018562 [Oedothorax gibbosus]
MNLRRVQRDDKTLPEEAAPSAMLLCSHVCGGILRGGDSPHRCAGMFAFCFACPHRHRALCCVNTCTRGMPP